MRAQKKSFVFFYLTQMTARIKCSIISIRYYAHKQRFVPSEGHVKHTQMKRRKERIANKLCKCILPIALLTLLLGSCLTTVSAGPPTGKVSPKKKYALLCGCATFLYLLDYPEPARYACIENYGAIPPVYNDIATVRDTLVDYCDWLPDHITILLNENSTKANVMQGIRSLKQYDSSDSLFLIVLASHGWVVEDEDGDEAAYPNIGDREGNDPWDECWQPYDGIPGGQGEASLMVNFIIDDELKLLFDELDFQGKLVVDFICCCGSGLIEDIAGPNRIAFAVGDADKLEMHWWDIHLYKWYALRGCTGVEFPYIDLYMDPDSNGDGKISLEEAHWWAVAANEATDPNYVGWGGGPLDLYMVDEIEGETFL